MSKLEPLVAAPHSPDNRRTAHECSGTKIDRVYIGCAFCVQDFTVGSGYPHRRPGRRSSCRDPNSSEIVRCFCVLDQVSLLSSGVFVT